MVCKNGASDTHFFNGKTFIPCLTSQIHLVSRTSSEVCPCKIFLGNARISQKRDVIFEKRQRIKRVHTRIKLFRSTIVIRTPTSAQYILFLDAISCPSNIYPHRQLPHADSTTRIRPLAPNINLKFCIPRRRHPSNIYFYDSSLPHPKYRPRPPIHARILIQGIVNPGIT